MIIAEIIKENQPEIYDLLNRIYCFGVIRVELDRDEDYEFQEIKKMMEKPRGVKL